jgi:hypothetical protein
VERAVRLPEIVDVERSALDVLGGGVVGERAMNVTEGFGHVATRRSTARPPLPEEEGWGERTHFSA